MTFPRKMLVNGGHLKRALGFDLTGFLPPSQNHQKECGQGFPNRITVANTRPAPRAFMSLAEADDWRGVEQPGSSSGS
jgi:hypothetical protein